MALATTIGLEHLPLGERPQYGQPYPEGIAVAASNVPDDATGGTHTFSINADPGFLYRLELLNWTRGEELVRTMHIITTHQWATGRTPFDAAAFDLNWFLEPVAKSGFAVYTLCGGSQGADGGVEIMSMIKRFPMGSAGGGAPGVSTQLMFLTTTVQLDTITNEISVVWTYWRKQSLYLPGFLSSFYEAPAVPPLVR